MKCRDPSGFNGISAGCIGDHLIQIARIGGVDGVTGKIRVSAKIDHKDKLLGVVFNERLGIGSGSERFPRAVRASVLLV